MNSQFAVDVVEGPYGDNIVCVFDRGAAEGALRVVDEAPDVVSFVVERYGNHPLIVYGSSPEEWDQLIHQDGVFISVHPLHEATLHSAIEKCI